MAQCPEPSPSGAYVFDTQAEVDNLLADFPNCTELLGYVNIAHEAGTTDPITNLNGFINITSIENLNIKETTSLTNLTGLDNLTQLIGSLFVDNNIALESVDGLESLTAIGVNNPFAMISFYNNTALTDITALQNVNSGFIQYVVIADNPLLASLEGMDNMIFDPAMFDFQITNNPTLSVCAVEKICEYITTGGAATINNNAPGCGTIGEVTTNCQINFPSCPENDVTLATQAEVDQFLVDYPFCAIIPGTLTINDAGTDPIVNLDGLQNIQTVYGLTIQNTTLTDFSGLDALVTINGNVMIDNISVNNIAFLSGITMIDGNLVMQNNSALTNLMALNTLTHLDGALEITNNDALTTLSGLDNIISNTITNLVIENNENLSTCNMDAVCIYLANGWPATISGNDTGCDTVAEVEGTCNTAVCPPGDVEFNTQAQLDYFILQYPNCTQLSGALEIYDTISEDRITNLNALQNITHIEGLTRIMYTEIENFEGLNNLETTGAGLHISLNGSLVDFQGMENLQEVGGSLTISNCDSLESFDGLQGVTTVYGGITLNSCPLITNFEGFDSLTQVVGSQSINEMRIYDNNSLTSLDGLENLTTIATNLRIEHNPLLNSLSALSGITQIGADVEMQSFELHIQGNPSLQTLDGLENLTTVYGSFSLKTNTGLTSIEALANFNRVGYLTISNNNALTSLHGLEGFVKIGGLDPNFPFAGGTLIISSNDALTNFEGLNNLQTIGGLFSVNENESLVNFQGLNNLETIGKGLQIGRNPSLVSLDGLDNLTRFGVYSFSYPNPFAIGHNDSLTSIEGLMNITEANPGTVAIHIEGNPVLTSLSGLDNFPVNAIRFVSLQQNGELSLCSIPSVCGFIATNPPANLLRIEGNISGCNTVAEIEDACALGIEDVNLGNSITLHPNPMQERLTVSTSNGVVVEAIKLYDTTGKLIVSVSGEQKIINVANLSSGIYFISIETNNGLYQQKLVK